MEEYKLNHLKGDIAMLGFDIFTIIREELIKQGFTYANSGLNTNPMFNKIMLKIVETANKVDDING